jgi:CBS-domain-containing membrane protein
VESHVSVGRAVESMNLSGYGFLPITNSGRIAGVVTGRDLAIRASARGVVVDELPIAAVMTSPAITVYEDTEIEDALISMRHRDVRRLVVVNQQLRVVGVVGLSDLVGAAPDASIVKNLQRHAENCPRLVEMFSVMPGSYLT